MVTRGFRIDHVTAVVTDSGEAAGALGRLLGKEPSASLRVGSMDIRSFSIGDAELNLNAPTGPGVVADHHERHGPSLHHLALRVTDLDARLDELSREGFRPHGSPVETAPGLREVFLDPTTTAGLWIQLVERVDADTDRLDALAVEALAASSNTDGRTR